MKRPLLLVLAGTLSACGGHMTPTTVPPASLRQVGPQVANSCKFKRDFVREHRLYGFGAVPIVTVQVYEHSAYTSFSVWNHLHDSSVNVWPTNDQSAMITVPPTTQTQIMAVSPPAKQFAIQQVTAEKDPGPGVELNGKVCQQAY
jgi:outer membrane lipopolysaccharide assembly protein LptE/RlpB